MSLGDALTWGGIAICVAHSAMFSGLNLALFSLSRLRLEIEAERGHHGAIHILQLRRDANYLLTTILWGNVAANCLLTLLSDSMLAGVGAFAFSTFGITLLGEIVPQAYFSRHAMRTGAMLAPLLRFYQVVLYPVARPSGKLLDLWLGPEGIGYLRERDLRAVIEKHMEADEADMDREEGLGALNFLDLDDLPLAEEGEPVDPKSVIPLDVHVDLPVFPPFAPTPDDPLVLRIQASGRKWAVLTNLEEEPLLVLDVDAFVRGLFRDGKAFNPYEACHRPIVVQDPRLPIGDVLPRLKVRAEHPDDDVIDHDLVLLWGKTRRIVTGADLLGRLLRGIVAREEPSTRQAHPTSA